MGNEKKCQRKEETQTKDKIKYKREKKIKMKKMKGGIDAGKFGTRRKEKRK